MVGFGKLARCVVLVSLCGCSDPEESGPLELGALYQGFENTSGGSTPANNYYLRFIDGDTVLNTVSADSPEKIRTWFEKGAANVNSEDYELDGNTIRIVYNIASQYDGTIEGDRISFRVTTTGEPPMYERHFVLLRQ
jgi:hypothetical protein